MARRGDPEDWRLFVLLLQSFKFQNARQLSEASGVSPKMISRYQLAQDVPSPETVRRLVDTVGFPRGWVAPMLALLHSLRIAVESGTQAPDEGEAELLQGLEPQVHAALRLALTPALLELNAVLGAEVKPREEEDEEEKPN